MNIHHNLSNVSKEYFYLAWHQLLPKVKMNNKLRKFSKLESTVTTFALLLFCFLKINTAEAGICDIKKELEGVVDTATKDCIKSLGIAIDDKNTFKDVETTFDDKGLVLCTLQKLKMANDDGVIDMIKVAEAFFDGADTTMFDKVGKACKEKSDAKFKDEADKTAKSRKSTYLFMHCFQTDICATAKKS